MQFLLYCVLNSITEYYSFVVDQPDTSLGMYSFYLFNITNAANVFQRGDEPDVVEVTVPRILKADLI